MWYPKQRLKKDVIAALLVGGFDPVHVEFLGWLSYAAAALNNSRNPVKAGHTLLEKIDDPESNMAEMWETFERKKMDTIAPADAPAHPVADEKLKALKHKIQAAYQEAQITSQGYRDFTQGGISDGSDQEEEVAPAAIGSEDSNE